jgi:hypothetical protein
VDSVAILCGGGKAESAPNRFIFPNTKNEIEKKVASTFLNLISKNEKYDLSVGYRLIENPENNLDFFVECPAERKGFEPNAPICSKSVIYKNSFR